MKRSLLLLALAISACSTPKTYYNGVIDDANCEFITGWVMDWNRALQSLDIRIWDDGGLVNLKVNANLPRSNFKPGQQLHGFTVPIPGVLQDGKPHMVHVAFENSREELRHSPRPLSCPAVH
jgi:hypothetical protein